MKNKIFVMFLILVLATSFLGGCTEESKSVSEILKFKSGQDLLDALEEARETRYGGYEVMEMAASAPQAGKATVAADGASYSETNIQVEGVDEADIIKTDGEYIYTLNHNTLIIARAYPADDAEILVEYDFENFYGRELFIHGDRLLVFGSTSIGNPVGEEPLPRGASSSIAPRGYYSFTSARLYDISDRSNPELVRSVDFEGNYITSRKIDEYVYFVVNAYPRFSYLEGKIQPLVECEEVLPVYREDDLAIEPVARCIDVGYVEPLYATSFITVASLSMVDKDEEVQKEVIVGAGHNVYASLDNLYLAQTNYPQVPRGVPVEDFDKSAFVEQTIVSKFSLDDGDVDFEGVGEVPGHVLNQFSMDEYEGHFRIATTITPRWGLGEKYKVSTNNVYILDDDLEIVGSVEDLAPDERIYSVRFMGERGYVVTFKKVDPLFVIDLKDPEKPKVLGKLKIPGYSDYLHPYDETHLIGVGKDTIEASEELTERGDFAWYQGIKMAIFDVSDVENPIEMHKIIIGDRGTDSPALHDHKAFLFDRERELLVLPILLAEIPEDEKKEDQSFRPQYGDYVEQGAFVYNVNLDDGFNLKGVVTHYEDDDKFVKSGYRFWGSSAVYRSLFIGDVLYTLSRARIQLNDLDSLDRLDVLEFSSFEEDRIYY